MIIAAMVFAFLLGWLCGEAWEATRPRRLNKGAGESAPPLGHRTDNGDAGKEHQPGPFTYEEFAHRLLRDAKQLSPEQQRILYDNRFELYID